MVTLIFQKLFIKGNLKGITVDDKLSFVNKERAMIWVNSILKKEQEKKLDFKLVSYSL